jgi:AmmeMemoRadiSam system protein A
MTDLDAYSLKEQEILLSLARKAIEEVWAKRRWEINPVDYPSALRKERATFVTLEKKGNLRGCIGSLVAREALVSDLIRHARAAAFEDPRFPPLSPEEKSSIDIHISVLSPTREMDFSSQKDLLDQLEAGRDGLVLLEGDRQATFLPSVWNSLPVAEDFLGQLKVKMGFPPDYWSPRMQARRYRVFDFSGPFIRKHP